MKKSKLNKNKLKKWYQNKFPHIPFLITFLLMISAIVFVVIEFIITHTLSGIGLNIATEIIGILLTILLVDYFIQKKRGEEWKNIHSNVRASLLGLLMGFDTFLLLLHKKLDTEKYKDENIYKVVFNNLDSILVNLNDKEFEKAINQISDITKKHIEGILSDVKLNPKPEYMKEIINIRNQANFLSTWPNFIQSPIYQHGDKKEAINKFLIKSFKAIIYNLSEIDKKLLFEYPKIKPVPMEFVSYLAFNKAMGITKDVQDVRDSILSKIPVDKLNL